MEILFTIIIPIIMFIVVKMVAKKKAMGRFDMVFFLPLIILAIILNFFNYYSRLITLVKSFGINIFNVIMIIYLVITSYLVYKKSDIILKGKKKSKIINLILYIYFMLCEILLIKIYCACI